MYCPTCEKTPLSPTELEHGLPSLGCKSCAGHLVSLVSYRLWHERFRTDLTSDQSAHGELESDTKNALLCPKCQRLMLKYKYTVNRTSSLDLCTHCDDVWLDGGEWEHVRRLEITDSLPAMFTEPWQRALRHQRSAQSVEQLWREALGDDYDRAVETAGWISNSPYAAQILRYLNNPDIEK